MIKPLLFLLLPFAQIHSLPVQNTSFEELSLEEKTEEEVELSQESLFNEEEEISALPKQGSRPQVVQIPTKTQ
jgi:hypothetical protein